MNHHRGLLLAGVAAALFGGLLPSARGSCASPFIEIVKPAAQHDRPARLAAGRASPPEDAAGSRAVTTPEAVPQVAARSPLRSRP